MNAGLRVIFVLLFVKRTLARNISNSINLLTLLDYVVDNPDDFVDAFRNNEHIKSVLVSIGDAELL